MSDGGTLKKYKSGEVIFSEGEPSAAAYVIVKGAVELTKNSKHGPVRLASLKAGELFGEMGVIDGSARSATARANGHTTLKEIAPENLLKGIQNDPNLSSKVMSKLVERLRAADEMLAKAGVSAAGSPATNGRKNINAPKKKGFLSRLFGSDKGRQSTFEILVADLFDDENTETTDALFHALKNGAEKLGNAQITVRRTNTPFALADFNDTPTIWGQIKSNAQRCLTEMEGDLLVWGQVRNAGQTMHLRMVPAHVPRHERAGMVRPYDGVDVPCELDDVLQGYLYGVSVAALSPVTRKQMDAIETILPSAAENARPALQKRMRELKGDDMPRFEAGFAHLLAATGHITKQSNYFKEAEQAYLKALRNIRHGNGMLSGIIKRHLGFTQLGWFENGGEANLLEAAIESLRECTESFERTAFPTDWADLQATIGQLLYKKDQTQADDSALKESIAAYRNALQVFTATATPQRWGEAKHHLARALQLLGSQTGDLDMIARSAEACREALVVRSKAKTPMLWAATQNNLGSALFMLCQKTRKPETAEAAVKAFEAALEVYEARKATKLAQVTQNNLARAKEVTIDLGALNEAKAESKSVDFKPEDFDEDADKAAEEETKAEE